MPGPEVVKPAESAAQAALSQGVRAAREARALSVRELARRIGVSPSFISQIELGKANPSVGTLYALVAALGTTVDELVAEPGEEGARTGRQVPAAGLPAADAPGPASWRRVETPVQPTEGRKRVEMSGVVWERLTHDHDPHVDFLHVAYASGSASCPPDNLMTHGGREYGHLLTGRLEVQVGFDTYSLGPGDSIHFDSSTPHRLSNPYDEPCTAIWFVVARTGDDRLSGS